MAGVLQHKFVDFTSSKDCESRSLCAGDLAYLAEKLFGYVPTEDDPEITFDQFARVT